MMIPTVTLILTVIVIMTVTVVLTLMSLVNMMMLWRSTTDATRANQPVPGCEQEENEAVDHTRDG